MTDKYLVEHLKKYVLFEVDQGYHPNDIKDALLKYGYHNEIIKKVFSELGRLKAPLVKAPSKKQMKEDMQFYIQNMLIDYIKKQKKNGYSIQAIKRALTISGHHMDMINKAIKEIRSGKVIDYDIPDIKTVPSKFVFGFAIIVLLAFVSFLGVVSDENILKVLLTFTPAIAALIITELVVASVEKRGLVRLMPLFSIVIAVLIYVLLINNTLVYERANTTLLLGLNVAAAFVLGAVICVFSKKAYGKKR